MLTMAKDLPADFGKPKTATTKEGKIVAAVARGFAPVIRDHVEDRIAKALAPLLERIKELEARPQPEWQGTFSEGKQYRELSFVVSSGSLWVAKCNTTARPGISADWQLACKRGQAR